MGSGVSVFRRGCASDRGTRGVAEVFGVTGGWGGTIFGLSALGGQGGRRGWGVP